MKEHFISKDNVLDKSLIQLVKDTEFCCSQEIVQLEHDVLEIVANLFTAGDEQKAIQILEKDEKKIRRADMFILSFFGGSVGLLILLLSYDMIREKDIFDLEAGDEH